MEKCKALINYLNGDYNQNDKNVLIKKKILKKVYYSQDEVVRKIKQRDFKNCVLKTCEWCGNKVLIIHLHHFPIEKRDGGTKIVKICPNCHCEYHLLINGNYELDMKGNENGS